MRPSPEARLLEEWETTDLREFTEDLVVQPARLGRCQPMIDRRR